MSFTKRAIESLTTGKLTDPTQPGLLIEASSRRKIWRYYRRVAGSGVPVRLSLGPWPAHDIAEARQWAGALNHQIEAGIDPRSLERSQRGAAMTVGEAHALYMAAMERGDRKRLKPRTIADKRVIWSRDLAPRLDAKRLHEVAEDHLWEIVEAKGDVAPVREPRRVCRRLIDVSYAAMRVSSSMA